MANPTTPPAGRQPERVEILTVQGASIHRNGRLQVQFLDPNGQLWEIEAEAVEAMAFCEVAEELMNTMGIDSARVKDEVQAKYPDLLVLSWSPSDA